MIQTLDLPVLSLAIPNIHKLNNINADNLSCMWTVFSKCKDNLENGRRLENMSWRLWYRESAMKDSSAHTTTSSTSSSPIDIQSPVPSDDTKQHHLSPASFKRIISSLNNDTDIKLSQPKPILLEEPNNQLIKFERPQPVQHTTQHKSKFFVEEDKSETDYEDDDAWSSEEEEERQLTPKDYANTAVGLTKKKFTIDESEEEEDYDDDDQYEDVIDEGECDETAFLSEFKKRSPLPISMTSTKQNSLLSNMLRAQGITRLANQTINVAQNQSNMDDLLSTSMRNCLEWEKHALQHDFKLDNSNCKKQYELSNNHNTSSPCYW